MSIDDIPNFMEISDQLGTSGQPGRNQFNEICSAGYKAVINLAMGNSINALQDESDLVSGLGMEYIHIPVVWTAPREDDLLDFLSALQRLRGKKVFAHCALNYRVSSFVYLYRVTCLGEDAQQAWWDVLSIWEPDPVWSKFIQNSMDRLLESRNNPI